MQHFVGALIFRGHRSHFRDNSFGFIAMMRTGNLRLPHPHMMFVLSLVRAVGSCVGLSLAGSTCEYASWCIRSSTSITDSPS